MIIDPNQYVLQKAAGQLSITNNGDGSYAVVFNQFNSLGQQISPINYDIPASELQQMQTTLSNLATLLNDITATQAGQMFQPAAPSAMVIPESAMNRNFTVNQ